MKQIIKSAVFGVLCLILSVLITIQLRITNLSESNSSKAKIADRLKDQILSLNDENSKLEEKLKNSTELLGQARIRASENDVENIEKSDLIKKYNTFLGNTDIYGEGLSITYTPSRDSILADTAKDLRYIVNELKNVGVEAISINGQRLGSNSAIEMVKNKIEINDVELESPYTIDVIGNSDMINNGITRPGGIIELIRLSGVKISINLKDKIEISKYSEI